ncbi:MAG: DUF4215 domain-containing protein [Myxococcota bacterium]|nr:DUF4215 domain-containing protein [Myxococcota bacterium]
MRWIVFLLLVNACTASLEKPEALPVFCGDGKLNDGEACDDGNLFETDACTTVCTIARCGDGYVREDTAADDPQAEECDDGNDAEDDACTSNCRIATCGDGLLRTDLSAGEPGFEACDDGNPSDTDDCLTTCVTAQCGDGFLHEEDELCDDGNRSDTDSCPSGCRPAVCGDGFHRTDLGEGDEGYEACDDGNIADDDECTTDCQLGRCGDGILAAVLGETCDDGNDVASDACTDSCLLAACGDGLIRTDIEEGEPNHEACDDGNESSADDCRADCQVNICGDGVVNPLREDCDDANRDNNDACLDECVDARCGDGFVRVDLEIGQDHYEACDDGNEFETDACLSNCERARCGDGFVWENVESCDDQNQAINDDCILCQEATCGDGYRREDLAEGEEGFEACDDGENNNLSGACLPGCIASRCGDGEVYIGVEDCDDGDDDNEDECTEICEPPHCGDGLVQNGEECDDGNEVDRDACTTECIEAFCGDGLLYRAEEECDDANQIEIDACRNDCTNAVCGDGVIRAGVEQCDDGNVENGDDCTAQCRPAIVRLSNGWNHSCGLFGDGRIRCWGDNEDGQLGNGNNENERRPTLVDGAPEALESIHSGGNFTLALGGSVAVWGGNGDGQLGLGNNADSNTPLPLNLDGILDVASGWHHSCVVVAQDEINRVACFGHGSWGQLGYGQAQNRTNPTYASELDELRPVRVAAGEHHSCAALEDGRVYCWGRNREGQLGDGTDIQRNIPTEVPNLTLGNPAILAAGGGHTCAVATGQERQLYCWGKNSNGQLGDGTREERQTPTLVTGASSVVAVALGRYHSCAAVQGENQEATVKCWGKNNKGQLGDGSTTRRLSPVTIDVTLSIEDNIEIHGGMLSAGEHHNCAVTTGRLLYCWGDNASGQIGDGSITRRSRPQLINTW